MSDEVVEKPYAKGSGRTSEPLERLIHWGFEERTKVAAAEFYHRYQGIDDEDEEEYQLAEEERGGWFFEYLDCYYLGPSFSDPLERLLGYLKEEDEDQYPLKQMEATIARDFPKRFQAYLEAAEVYTRRRAVSPRYYKGGTLEHIMMAALADPAVFASRPEGSMHTTQWQLKALFSALKTNGYTIQRINEPEAVS